MKKIIHIINSLGDGGAERNLYNLVCEDRKNNRHTILVLSKKNKYSKLLKEKKIQVIYFNFNSFFNTLKSVYHIYNFVSKNKPNLISTWLVHSDIVGSIVGKLLNVKVVWNIRTGYLPLNYLKIRTYLLYFISRYFYKYLCNFIIINSIEAKKFYRLKKNYIYIPNNLNFNFINNKKKLNLKNFKRKKYIIGQVARYDYLKNNEFLIETMNYLVNKKKIKNITCLMVGKNIDNKNKQLNFKIKKYNLENYIILLGQVKEIYKVYNVLDIHILTSLSEGVPNTVLESTYLDVHNLYPNLINLRKIFGNKNCFKKGSISSLAMSIIKYLSNSKKYHNLKKRNKKIVYQKFNVKKNVGLYNLVWDKILKT